MSAWGGKWTNPLCHSGERGNPANKRLMKPDFSPTVYLLASRRNGTVYTGVSSNLAVRVAQHRNGTFAGFSRKHGVKLLVWFEQHETMEQAILREKRIKKWLRGWKLDLIETGNPDWRDLAEDLGFAPLEEVI